MFLIISCSARFHKGHFPAFCPNTAAFPPAKVARRAGVGRKLPSVCLRLGKALEKRKIYGFFINRVGKIWYNNCVKIRRADFWLRRVHVSHGLRHGRFCKTSCKAVSFASCFTFNNRGAGRRPKEGKRRRGRRETGPIRRPIDPTGRVCGRL